MWRLLYLRITLRIMHQPLLASKKPKFIDFNDLTWNCSEYRFEVESFIP